VRPKIEVLEHHAARMRTAAAPRSVIGTDDPSARGRTPDMFAVQKNLAPVAGARQLECSEAGSIFRSRSGQYAHGLALHHAQVDFGEHLMVTEALADAADLTPAPISRQPCPRLQAQPPLAVPHEIFDASAKDPIIGGLHQERLERYEE